MPRRRMNFAEKRSEKSVDIEGWDWLLTIGGIGIAILIWWIVDILILQMELGPAGFWFIVSLMIGSGGGLVASFYRASTRQTGDFQWSQGTALAGFVLVIFGLLIAGFSGQLGAALFPKPPPPPTEIATGYCEIEVYDYTNERYMNLNNITLLNYTNEVEIAKISNNTKVLINQSTLVWIQVKGYYNLSSVLLANADPDDPYINRFTLYRIPNSSRMYLDIIQIDGVYGNYSSTDITDGKNHSVTYRYMNLGVDTPANNHTFGIQTFVPSPYVSVNSLAYNQSMNGQFAFLAINNTIENPKINNIEPLVWTYTNITNNNWTVVMVPSMRFQEYITISGFWKGNTSITHLCYGFIDNYDNPLNNDWATV